MIHGICQQIISGYRPNAHLLTTDTVKGVYLWLLAGPLGTRNEAAGTFRNRLSGK